MIQKEMMRTNRVPNNHAEPPMSEEKHRIYEALKAYRKKHSVGCFKHVSDATGGLVTMNTITNMYAGIKVNNETWLQVGTALAKLAEEWRCF